MALALVVLVVIAEALLQLPFVRERVRVRAERALAQRVPGATIARCAALDVTGVARFDGVRIEAADRAAVVVDGLSVSVKLLPLLRGRVEPSRLRAAAARVHVEAPALGPVTWELEPESDGGIAVMPESAASPGITRVTVRGPSRACRETVCLSGQTFLELELDRIDPAHDVVRFQAFGDDVRISDTEEAGAAAASEDAALTLPPVAAHGTFTRPRTDASAKKTTKKKAKAKAAMVLDLDASIGPHGAVDVGASLSDERFQLDVVCSTESYAALLGSLPLDLKPVRELGVDGPVRATASASGAIAEPQSWEVAMKLDLKKLRAQTRANAPKADDKSLRGTFLYNPSADPKAPSVWMGPRNPDFLPIAEIPEIVVKSVLLSEDSFFFAHDGFDAAGIVHAMKTNLREERVARGGSTISQQLAKNLWLSRDRTYRRKFEEALLTIALEAALPKERILEIYLNGIEWGPGIYGVKAASRHYFGKSPRELTPKEAAYLATVIPSPRRYYSYFRKGELSEKWEARVMQLLGKLHEAGTIDDAQLEEAAWAPLRFTSSGDDPWTSEVEAQQVVPFDVE